MKSEIKTPTTASEALARAADAARHAPSVHNTQPWRWTVDGDRLELSAATDRQLQSQDPDGRMLLISCGTALHHAEVALAAAGWRYRVERPAAEPLAVIHAENAGPATPEAQRRLRSLELRRTDRRAVGPAPIAPEVVQSLVTAATDAGTQMFVLSRDHVIELAAIVSAAADAAADDEQLRNETAQWVGGDRQAGTGVPDSAIPAELPLTTIAERDFGTAGTLSAGGGHDNSATYAVLYGPDVDPVSWLRAGESLSALWLSATEQGVTVLPLSGPVEVPFTWQSLRRMLGETGFPYLVLRFGTVDDKQADLAATPRLGGDQVIEMRG